MLSCKSNAFILQIQKESVIWKSPMCSYIHIHADQVQKLVLALTQMNPRCICLVWSFCCQVSTVIWPGFIQFWVCAAVCVCVVLLHYTGGRQQGWVQPSKQVECHWGGTNTVWTSVLLKEAWHEMLQVLLTAQCCSHCAVQNLVQVHLCGFVCLGKTFMHLIAQKHKAGLQRLLGACLKVRD